MEKLRPIYSRDLDIRVRALELRRFQLNRHPPEMDRIEDHSHQHAQILLYMSGAGSQLIGEEAYSVRRGTLFYIPDGVPHAFLSGNRRKPLCLAIDLSLKGEEQTIARQLNAVDLNRVRHLLSNLKRWRTGEETVEPCEAAAVLQLIDVLFRALGFLQRHGPPGGSTSVLNAVQRKLNEPHAFELSMSTLAARIGYQPDYLNRVLKNSCGMTLSGLRDDIRTQKAKRLLAGPERIAEVALELGFTDPSYFSRWFRHQTGQTPRAWRVHSTS